MRNGLIIALLLLLIWFGSAIVRLENERYALWLEICGRFDPANPPTLMVRERCLDRVQTRTSPIYNLVYGLKLI